MTAIEVVEADLAREDHAAAVVEMIDAYARDPMGGGAPLRDDVRRNLAAGLGAHPAAMVLLAYDGAEPVGVAVCFRGFSTFAARPLMNIHDLAVVPSCRGRGVGRTLLEAVERRARAMGCCKVTLEVLENNRRAREVYAAAGFCQAAYTATGGNALFLWKMLM